jgi:hypothetical protein
MTCRKSSRMDNSGDQCRYPKIFTSGFLTLGEYFSRSPVFRKREVTRIPADSPLSAEYPDFAVPLL